MSLHDSRRETLRVSGLRAEGVVLAPIAEKLHFTDEFGMHLGLTRLDGRAAPGARVVEVTPAIPARTTQGWPRSRCAACARRTCWQAA